MAIAITNSAQVLFSNISNNIIVNPSSGVTVMVWMRKNNWNEAGIRSFIGIYEVSASGAIQLGLNQSTTGFLNFWNWGGTPLTSYSVTLLNSGEWYHITYVYNGTNSLMYINGVLVNTTTVSPQNVNMNRSQVNGFPAIAPFTISGTELSGEYDIDDYRVYSRPLTQNEIVTIYNLRGKDNFVQNLVLHYMFDGLSVSAPVSSIFDATAHKLELINFSAQPIFIDKFIYNIR